MLPMALLGRSVSELPRSPCAAGATPPCRLVSQARRGVHSSSAVRAAAAATLDAAEAPPAEPAVAAAPPAEAVPGAEGGEEVQGEEAGEDGEVVQQKLRIKLKGFKNSSLEEAVTIIREAANGTGARAKGAASLPTRRKIFTVLRSPHVNKDSREHFEQRTYSKLVDIYGVNKGTLAMLMKVDLPAGVDVQIKL